MAKFNKKNLKNKPLERQGSKKTLWVMIFLIGILMVLFISAVNFEPSSMIEWYNGTLGTSQGATGMAQSFTIGTVSPSNHDSTLKGISLKGFASTTSTFCNYTLYSNAFVTRIANKSTDCSEWATTWFNVSMLNITLTASTQYWISIVGDGSAMNLDSPPGNNYAGGTNYYSTNNGGSWTQQTGNDIGFIIYNGSISEIIFPSIVVNLTSPLNNSAIHITTETLKSNFTCTDCNLTNATFYVWNSTNFLYNSSVFIINGTINNSNFEISGLNLDSYKWNVYVCGVNTSADTLCNWSSRGNFTLEVGATINNETYPEQIYETETAIFLANITLLSGANLFAAKLIYNGTSYLAEKTSLGSDMYSLKRTIDIPLLSGGTQNITFFWNFEYSNGISTTQNTSTKSHNVTQLIFGLFSPTLSTAFVNFTIYNETSRTIINSELDGAFNYWLGSGIIKKNYSLDSSSEVASYSFGLNVNKTIYINSIIRIQSSENFTERTFYFNKETYINTTTNQKLYLLDNSGRNIIIQARNSGLVPLVGYYSKIYRYYPSDNTYIIVERLKTDEYGQFVARLIEPNTVKYQFEFLDSDNNIQKRTGDMTIACRATICVIPFVIEDTISDIERFQNLTNYDWSLDFNNNTNIFTFTWNDVSGISATNWLKVERNLWNGTSIICNITSTAISGSMICNVGNSEASYNAQAFRKVGSGEWRRISVLSAKVGTTYQTFGEEGLIWSFFLLMIMISVGYWYPPVGIILYLFGIILLSILNIIYLNPAIIIAELVIGVALIFAFSGRS